MTDSSDGAAIALHSAALQTVHGASFTGTSVLSVKERSQVK